MKRPTKSNDGMYHIQNNKFSMLVGTRAQVWHGTAYKTTGGLCKTDIMMNKHGRIVSKAKHNTAKREKRLEKAGFFTKKGTFGSIKNTKLSHSKKHKSRKHKSRKH